MSEDTIGSSIVGYGGVVVPHLDEYQGFFINDDPALHQQAKLQMITAMGSGSHPIGALQAVIVDGVVKKQWPQVAVAALALRSITKDDFFIIEATVESGGIRTKMISMQARTIDAARQELENWPEVLAMKARLRVALAKKDLHPHGKH